MNVAAEPFAAQWLSSLLSMDCRVYAMLVIRLRLYAYRCHPWEWRLLVVQLRWNLVGRQLHWCLQVGTLGLLLVSCQQNGLLPGSWWN